VIPPISSEVLAQDLPNYKCELCKDSGRVEVEEIYLGRTYNGHKKCVCVLANIRRKKLTIVPPKFQNATIANLQADTTRHPKQVEFVSMIKQNPQGSYFLAGRFGTGKTHLMYALYHEAVMNDRRTIICSLNELLHEYKLYIQASISNQEAKSPRISAGELRQTHTKYSIFLDDVDKVKPTEFVCQEVFDLANAIYDFEHQIVLTTNFSLQKLVEHFGRADEQYGGSIVRRFVDNARICEMF
jgi:DNA replication protein DnaC